MMRWKITDVVDSHMGRNDLDRRIEAERRDVAASSEERDTTPDNKMIICRKGGR